jgi:hypothetical protein
MDGGQLDPGLRVHLPGGVEPVGGLEDQEGAGNVVAHEAAEVVQPAAYPFVGFDGLHVDEHVEHDVVVGLCADPVAQLRPLLWTVHRHHELARLVRHCRGPGPVDERRLQFGAGQRLTEAVVDDAP